MFTGVTGLLISHFSRILGAISVDEDLVLEKVDNSYTITATVFPSNATNKNLTWTTSDESVATVDNGVITAVGPGTATITVTSVADSSKKATVHVVVGDILVPAIFADDPTLGTLQGEIDKAEPGSTIVVAPATYNEQLIINKPLTLLGPNADIAGAAEKRYPEAIIKGTGNGLSQLLEIDAENVEINGFTFDDTRIDNYNNTTGTNTNLIGGIAIVNNRFINTSGTAIYLRDGRNAPGEYSKDIQICNNKIETIISAGTVDYNAGSGIIVMGAEDLRICGNIISNAAYNGIQLARNKNATVTDNIVTDSEQPALQIAQWNEGVHEISGNTFSTKSEEKGAIRLYGFTNNYIPEFNISNNKIENSHYGIQIGHGDAGKSYNDIRDANYSLIGNIFDDISEHELIIYLNTEPSNEEAEEMNTLFEDVYGEGYCARLISENDPFVYIGGLITWNDYADTSWYDDNPSAASFTIDTAEELAGLSKLVNENKIKFDGKTIFLGADIDLNNLEWVPIGSYYGTWFGGVFDGNGKTISGIKVSDNTIPEVGLFGYVRGSSDEAGIQNLTVSGRIDIYDNNTIKPISANNHTSEAGLLAAYVWGFVDNCHTTNVKDDNTVAFRSIYTGDRYRASIGGLVGWISVGDIKNSSFTGTVYGETDVTVPETNSGAFIGGLIGLANGSNVIKCDVDADVTGNTYRYLSLGGAIGYIMSNDRQYSDISYQGTVYGNVNIEGKQCQISTIEVGGLIGAGEFGGNTQIHNNTAEGILFGNAAANDHANVSVGGIVGEAYLKSNLTSYSLENNVTNLQISVEQTADALINVGGLVGTMYNASASANPSLEITFNACQVKGSINVESTVQGSDTECYVGGLLGSGIKLVDGTFVMNECTTITPTVSVDTSVKSAGDYWGRNDWAPVYIEGDEVVFYPTIQAAINAAEGGDTIILGAGIFEEGTINLPVRFEGITIKGSENHASIIKNSSIYRADGNNLYYNDIIIEGIVFDNSYILVTGQRTGTVEMNNWEIKNNIFINLTSAPNSIAAVHFNLGEGESAKGFVLTGNVFDNISNKNSTGQALWNNRLDKTAYIKNNVFMNLTDKQNPLNIQIENNNGNNDLIEITGNIFDTKFWPYIGGRSNTGEDSVTLKINDNEFYQCGLDDRTTVITVTNFNSANTSADLSNNHYDIDPSEYLDRFRYNGTIADFIEDLELLGFTPYYIIDAE